MSEPLAVEETERCIASDKVEGTKVYNPQGDKLGSVMNFMVDKRTGQVQYAVMEFGGLFGIGSEYYPLPWDVLDYEEEVGGYVVDLDKEMLEAAPHYREERPVWDDAFGAEIHNHYGVAYPYA